MLESNNKYQPKLSIWDGSKEPTINNFYGIDNKEFEYALKMRIGRSRQQYYISTEDSLWVIE